MSVRVEADADAAGFIRQHGGRFFIWSSDTGIQHADTKPHPGVEFDELAGDGFALFVDREIEAAHTWRLVFHRYPRPHIRVLWNGAVFSPGSARMPSWEGDNPWD